MSGKLVRRAVDIGAVVQAGQLIAELDPTDYKLAVENARAAFAAAEGRVAVEIAVFDRSGTLVGRHAS